MEENIKKMKSFETLIYSDQTLKVTLTPDRLVTIETHKPLPKLAPREPVARDSLITKSLPKSPEIKEEEEEEDFDIVEKRPQKENLYEFLKNSSPEDYNFKNKDSQKGDISSRRRGKPFDKLDTVSETSKSPTSPGSTSRHTPLVLSAKSSLSSPFSLTSSNTANSSLNTLHHSKSLDNTKNVGSPVSILKQKRPGNINLYNDDDFDDDFDDDKKGNRRQTQDLIDFLKTTPPSEKTTFPDSLKDSNHNSNGKKMETKIRKIFSILRIKSFSDDSNNNYNSSSGNNLNSANSTFSTSSTSTATLVTKQKARFIKIEIPPLPPKDNYEQNGFIGVQGRSTHQLIKAKSTTNLNHIQNNANPNGSSTSLAKDTARSNSKTDKYNEFLASNPLPKTIVSNNNDNNNVNHNAPSSKEISHRTNPSSPPSSKKPPTPSKTIDITNRSNNQNTTTNSIPVVTSIKTDKSQEQALTPKEKALPTKNSQEKLRQQQQQILQKPSPPLPPSLPSPPQQQQQKQKPSHQSHQSHQSQSKSQSIQKSLNKQEALIINQPQENKPEVLAPLTNDNKSIKSSETKGTVIPIVENNSNSEDDKLNGKVIDEKITSVETQVQEIKEEVLVINLINLEEREEGIVVEWLLGTCLTYKSVRDHLIQNEDNNVLIAESRAINYIDNVATGNNFVHA